MKKLAWRIALIFLIALGLMAFAIKYGWDRIEEWSTQAFEVPQETVIEVPTGISLRALSRSLEENQIVSNHWFFTIWVRATGRYPKFQAGKYRFEGAKSPVEIAQKIMRGETYNPVVYQVTIPEGFSLAQIVERLAAGEVASREKLWELARDPAILARHGIQAENLEGYLYPATYPFYHKPSAEEVFETMLTTFSEKLPGNYRERAKALGLSLQQALIFASLIELETLHDDEKPLVAEVIWRRLRNKMPLGIDAALIYGISDYAGDITWKHLRDASNLYNTRIHLGLPPTPVCSPSASSLEAVLNPAQLGYLYYVLDPDQGNRHHFSKTLEEHNRFVQRLKTARR